ncbi:hypothetical protein M9Y10_025147 [Tritrichomonas musculus]|uniref:Uncharacterized protein n=1 Tax=Tritrichomonas musculus TaxID=1915356 RepID=A0ABR2HBK2_9EUKA
MVKMLIKLSDSDTVITATRELLHFSRRFYQEEFHQIRMFYSFFTTRPYMRILTEIANASLQLGQDTNYYEEMVRFNHNDNAGARYPLICCYVKLRFSQARHKSDHCRLFTLKDCALYFVNYMPIFNQQGKYYI